MRLLALTIVSVALAASHAVAQSSSMCTDGTANGIDSTAFSRAQSNCNLRRGDQCRPADLAQAMNSSSSSTDRNAFEQCEYNGGGTCCVDLCYALQPSSCLSSPACMFVPLDRSKQCIQRAKVCLNVAVARGGDAATQQAACTTYSFCKWEGGACAAKTQEDLPTAPPGASVADECPKLHPVVIAMLVLMFLTFLGAVVLVAVVVYRNQKKFDEEEEHRMAAEAARAEAKRASRGRSNNNVL